MAFEVTDTGHLKDWQSWTEDFAKNSLAQEGIEYTLQHLQVLTAMREIYAQHKRVAGMRPLVNQLKGVNPEIASGATIGALFPGGISQVILLAGLPKTKRCV